MFKINTVKAYKDKNVKKKKFRFMNVMIFI